MPPRIMLAKETCLLYFLITGHAAGSSSVHMPEVAAASSSRQLDLRYSKRRRHQYYHGEYGEGADAFVNYCQLSLNDVKEENDGTLTQFDYANFLHDFCKHSPHEASRCKTSTTFPTLPLEFQVLFLDLYCRDNDPVKCLIEVNTLGQPVQFEEDISKLCEDTFEFVGTSGLVSKDKYLPTKSLTTSHDSSHIAHVVPEEDDTQGESIFGTTTVSSEFSPFVSSTLATLGIEPVEDSTEAEEETNKIIDIQEDGKSGSTTTEEKGHSRRNIAVKGIAGSAIAFCIVGLLVAMFTMLRRRALYWKADFEDDFVSVASDGSGVKSQHNHSQVKLDGRLTWLNWWYLPRKRSAKPILYRRSKDEEIEHGYPMPSRSRILSTDTVVDEGLSVASTTRIASSFTSIFGRKFQEPTQVELNDVDMPYPGLSISANSDASLSTYKFVSPELKDRFRQFDSTLMDGFEDLHKEMHNDIYLQEEEGNTDYDNDDDSTVDSETIRESLREEFQSDASDTIDQLEREALAYLSSSLNTTNSGITCSSNKSPEASCIESLSQESSVTDAVSRSTDSVCYRSQSGTKSAPMFHLPEAIGMPGHGTRTEDTKEEGPRPNFPRLRQLFEKEQTKAVP